MAHSLLPLAALAALVLTGCAGGSEGNGRTMTADPFEDVDPVGLGEGSPPPALTAGWKTDFTRHVVPLSEFRSGGLGKDGIPSIDAPRFVPVAEVDFLEPQEPVIELVVDKEVRAYPIQILIWHEIVNDEVGGKPVAVTFCPLCNTALVFDRRVDGRTLEFGATGNLRNSDLVMYDRQTESWWQQFGGAALVGRHAGVELDQLPARIVAWRQFVNEHPEALVLSRETGHSRPYGQNPYPGYDDASSPPWFPVRNSDDRRLPPKERVVFVRRDGGSVVIPYSTLARRKIVRIDVDGDRLVIRLRRGVASSLDESEIAEGRDVGAAEVLENGRLVPFEEPFWFVVAAFEPDARIVR